MPFDRRRRGYLRYLLAPLPWKVQDRLGDFAFDHPPFWQTLGALAVLYFVGPWPLAVVLVGVLALRAWRESGRRLRRATRQRAAWPVERAIWTVHMMAGWRWWLLRKLGLLVLPRSVPLYGGDLFLIGLRSAVAADPTYYLAARLPNPTSAAPRRRRRVVRVAACWLLEKPVLLRAATAGREAPPYIRALDPAEEEELKYRLASKGELRDERRHDWRDIRGAHHLFHKLWGMAHDHDNYDKPTWGELQGKLRQAGVWV